MVEQKSFSKETQLFYLVTFVPLIATLLIDYCTKSFAATFPIASFRFFGPVGFAHMQNSGVITGLYSESSPLLREVSLATIAAFLMVIYFMVQFLLGTRSLSFRVGLSLLMGGILGNVIDRMVNGSVTDFMCFGSITSMTPIFNLADAIQWIGYLVILFSIFRNWGKFWSETDLRNTYWIDSEFQRRFCLNLIASCLGFAIVIGALSFTYFKIAMSQISPERTEAIWKILISYLLVFGTVTVAFVMLLLMLGLILSHRIAGPIRAFERFLSEIESGKDPSFKLRTQDQFKNLEKLATKIKKIKKS